MSRRHLSGRAEWQGKSVARGAGAEDVFHTIMEMHLDGTEYTTVFKPTDLAGIYGKRKAGKTGRVSPHGVRPEYAICNTGTGKAIYVEIKRQKPAGNAHERACKYMMPGVVQSACKAANQPSGVIPFWWIFTNGLAKDQYYRQEIAHWFKGLEPHLFFWPQVRERKGLIDHFEQHIKPILA